MYRVLYSECPLREVPEKIRWLNYKENDVYLFDCKVLTLILCLR